MGNTDWISIKKSYGCCNECGTGLDSIKKKKKKKEIKKKN